MKKVFLLAVAIVLFPCSLSFASKKSEFTFGIDKILTYSLRNSISYIDGQKIATKIENGIIVPVKGKKLIKVRDPDTGRDIVKEVEFDVMINNGVSTVGSKDYGSNGFAPKLEYCYYVIGHRMGVGLGVNKFFNSDFDPFNAYLILKIALLINNKSAISFGTNFGYGIFNDKYETAQETFKANNVYSTKFFVKFEYKNFVVDLSTTMNNIPIDAKINTVNEGVKSVKENVSYDIIMLGIGYKFTI